MASTGRAPPGHLACRTCPSSPQNGRCDVASLSRKIGTGAALPRGGRNARAVIMGGSVLTRLGLRSAFIPNWCARCTSNPAASSASTAQAPAVGRLARHRHPATRTRAATSSGRCRSGPSPARRPDCRSVRSPTGADADRFRRPARQRYRCSRWPPFLDGPSATAVSCGTHGEREAPPRYGIRSASLATRRICWPSPEHDGNTSASREKPWGVGGGCVLSRGGHPG